MSSRWQPTTAKVQLKLCIQRLRMLSSKKEAQLKAQRREIASLVERAKLETARVRVETIINEEIHIELLEILELYCELISARFGLVETSRDLEPSVSEAVYGLVHASQRTELVRRDELRHLTAQRELHVLREMLLNHYGRGMVEEAASNAADRVTGKLAVRMPDKELVNAYLYEICRAYGVPFERPASLGGPEGTAPTPMPNTSDAPGNLPATPDKAPPDAEKDRTVVIHASGPAAVVPPSAPTPAVTPAAAPPAASENEFDVLQRRLAALKRG